MANKRVLVKRRKAVRNIRKITRTMQLIATARFQAAMARATASKPYAEKLAELVADLSESAEQISHPLMETHEDVKRSILLIITSMRGLCGGYNAGVLRTAMGHLDSQENKGVESDVHMVGKKGVGYFRFLKRSMAEQITHIGEVPSFEDTEPIANGFMDCFSEGEVASVHVAYMRFLSAGRQRPTVIQLLPLVQDRSADADAGEQQEPKGPKADFEFSPEPAELLGDLLPATVRVRLLQCFNDATVSEHIARMVAMKAATDAAEDMITMLSRKYNRARQTQITMELLDIVGGADALS